MGALEVPELRSAFERANIDSGEWANSAKLVDDMCLEQGISASTLGRFTELSQVEVYRDPDGASPTKTHLLAVLDVGLVLMREVGILKKRTDAQFLFFSEFGNGSFSPQESVGGRGWGHMDIQAAQGSLPLFRLGWYFDERSSDPRHAINAAAAERDRILVAIERWT
ncbi:MAG TPA: hypothetical protein VGW80_01030 [Solirubrobacterales bacterium]|jgi:hypothetical protein|nr:hypothetical protein [Solirubrobacterales bacterium]